MKSISWKPIWVFSDEFCWVLNFKFECVRAIKQFSRVKVSFEHLWHRGFRIKLKNKISQTEFDTASPTLYCEWTKVINHQKVIHEVLSRMKARTDTFSHADLTYDESQKNWHRSYNFQLSNIRGYMHEKHMLNMFLINWDF